MDCTKTLVKYLKQMPLVIGLVGGYVLALYIFLIPSMLILASDFPLAFWLASIGIAFFSSFMGAFIGVGMNVLMGKDFFDTYMKGR